MSSVIFTNIFRFVGLVLIQVLFLQRLSLEFPAFPYLNIFVYPLFILLLPFRGGGILGQRPNSIGNQGDEKGGEQEQEKKLE